MKTISRYILASFLLSFFSTLFVLTFVLAIGGLFKLSGLIAAGVDWRPLALILLMTLPQIMSVSLPISILVSVLLVFGRLSADSEIVAMQSCGISMFRIVLPVWFCGLFLSLVCFGIYNRVIPFTHHKTRVMVAELKESSVEKLIKEGQFVECVPGVSLYVGKRVGSMFHDIRIFDSRSGFRQEITAKTGCITNSADSGKLIIKLKNVRINPFKKGRPGAAYCSLLPVEIDPGRRKSIYHPKVTDFTGMQLIRKLHDLKPGREDSDLSSAAVKRSQLLVELNSRTVMSLSCLVFAVLGIPLGIKSHRKERSAGIIISLFLIVFFFMFMAFADSMAKQPSTKPHLIVWVPVIISVFMAFVTMRRK